MSKIEIIDELTSIVQRQSQIIYELYSIVKQLEASTSLCGEVDAITDESIRVIERADNYGKY